MPLRAHVLLADASPQSRRMGTAYLEDLGWQVQAVATSGSSSLGLSLNRSTVRAGDTALLTVTLLSQPMLGPTELYGVVSQSTSGTQLWPMLVQAR